jgi:hypothetical protein
VLIMNISSSKNESFRLELANGPAPDDVPQTAKPERIRAAVAVSRWLQRKAAQVSGRMARKPSGLVAAECATSGLNTTSPIAAAPAYTAARAIRPPLVAAFVQPRTHSIIAGAMTRAPAASPNHHVMKIGTMRPGSAYPARVRLPTPTSAAIGVAHNRPINAKRVTPLAVSNVAVPPDQRLISQAPARLSNVLPSEIAADVATDPAVVALARKAASRMAGQTREPRNKTAASARPVAGQIGVAFGLIEASNKPALAQAR